MSRFIDCSPKDDGLRLPEGLKGRIFSALEERLGEEKKMIDSFSDGDMFLRQRINEPGMLVCDADFLWAIFEKTEATMHFVHSSHYESFTVIPLEQVLLETINSLSKGARRQLAESIEQNVRMNEGTRSSIIELDYVYKHLRDMRWHHWLIYKDLLLRAELKNLSFTELGQGFLSDDALAEYEKFTRAIDDAHLLSTAHDIAEFPTNQPIETDTLEESMGMILPAWKSLTTAEERDLLDAYENEGAGAELFWPEKSGVENDVEIGMHIALEHTNESETETMWTFDTNFSTTSKGKKGRSFTRAVLMNLSRERRERLLKFLEEDFKDDADLLVLRARHVESDTMSRQELAQGIRKARHQKSKMLIGLEQYLRSFRVKS